MNLKLSLDTLLEILGNWEKDKVWISFSGKDIKYLESNVIVKGLGTYYTKKEIESEIINYKQTKIYCLTELSFNYYGLDSKHKTYYYDKNYVNNKFNLTLKNVLKNKDYKILENKQNYFKYKFADDLYDECSYSLELKEIEVK